VLILGILNYFGIA